MRTVTLQGLQSMFAETSGAAWLPAATITHEDLPDTIRVVANTEPITYAGNEYLGCPFELYLAADTEQSVTQAKIKIDNVSNDISMAIRAPSTSPSIDLEIFRVDPNGTVTREVGPDHYLLLSAKVDAAVAEGTLGFEADFLNEPATCDRFTPSVAPGLF